MLQLFAFRVSLARQCNLGSAPDLAESCARLEAESGSGVVACKPFDQQFTLHLSFRFRVLRASR